MLWKVSNPHSHHLHLWNLLNYCLLPKMLVIWINSYSHCVGLFLWCFPLPSFLNFQTYLWMPKLNFFLHNNSCFVKLDCEYFPFFICSFSSKFLQPTVTSIPFLLLHWKFHSWSHQGCEEGDDYHWIWRCLQLLRILPLPRPPPPLSNLLWCIWWNWTGC